MICKILTIFSFCKTLKSAAFRFFVQARKMMLFCFLSKTYINHVISFFLFVSFFIGLSILNQIVAWTLGWNYQTNKSVVCNFFACESSCRRSCFLGSTSTKQIYTRWIKYSVILDCLTEIFKQNRFKWQNEWLFSNAIFEIVSQEISCAHFLVLSKIHRRNRVINKCHHPVRMSSILQQVHHVKRFFWIMLITMKHTQSLRKNNEFSRN